MTQTKRTTEDQAKITREYIELRQRPYWYDKTYGTNIYGLNGRIPSIFEIEEMDTLRAGHMGDTP